MSVRRLLLSSARLKRGRSVLSLSSFSFPIFQNDQFSPWRNSKANILYLSSFSTSVNRKGFKRETIDRDFNLNNPFIKLLACNPECVSIDEHTRRIFISDSYNNRIIITNIKGKILDCIGDSSPGFEDGEFEFAKLSNPASSYYCHASDSLYFIDSQNNGIRRADLQKRVVETIYPACIKTRASTWKWILNKLGLSDEKINIKSQESEFNISEIKSPWHLIDINDENMLLVIDRKFEMAWIVDIANGSIKEIINGSQSIMELSENIIKERVSLLKDIYPNNNLSVENYKITLPLLSSIASFENQAIFCDTDMRRIMKYNLDSKSISKIQISNFGVLGLPHWIICPLERVYTSNLIPKGREHIHSINVLPGKCDIKVFINVPTGTEMASPLDENSILRQIRGAAASQISLSENEIIEEEKVGVAQQWFDELDNLAFTQNEDENSNNNKENIIISDNNNNNNEKVYFDCALNVSPGTCEVVVCAALYLKISKEQNNQEEIKSILLRVLKPEISKNELNKIELFFLKFEESLKDLVFVKPLRLRIKIECGDHPTGDKINEIILTDSSLSLNVSL